MPKIEKRRGFIGIDPGSSNGGIALKLGDERAYWAMPSGDNAAAEIFDIFERYVLNERDVAWFVAIEWINPGFASISKSSAAKLYGSYKELCMLLTVLRLPFVQVNPKVWQKELGVKFPKGCKGEDRKLQLVRHSRQMFPDLPLWERAMTHQKKIADALLLCEYARRVG